MKLAVATLALMTACPSLRADDWGYTEPRHMVKMSFSEAGVIAAINVSEGDRVTSGRLLAQLDVGVLEKEVQISRELLRQGQFKSRMLEELAKDGKASQEELERSQSELRIEQLKIERGEAQIRSRSIIAPYDGVVIDIRKDVGESVTPSSGLVLTVVQLKTLVVNMHLPRQRAAGLRQGMAKTLHLPGGEGAVQAVIDYVSPVADPATKTIHVKFSVSNPGGRIPSGARVTLAPPAQDGATPAVKQPK